MNPLIRIVAAIAIFAECITAQAPPTGFCYPNTPGVATCPCANPPMIAGAQGCNNYGDGYNTNMPTGGAQMFNYGNSSVSSDTLDLIGVGLNPYTFALLLESRNSASGGIVYGAGIRCLTDPIHRVFGHKGIRLACSNGGALAGWGPDYGDPQISEDIRATIGETTYFQVWYRDPNATLYCPNSNTTFNISSGLIVTWSP